MSMFVGTLALGELHLDKERHKHPDHFVHKHQDNTLGLFHSTPSKGSASPRQRRTESAPARSPGSHSPGGTSISPLATLGNSWRSWRSQKSVGDANGTQCPPHKDEEEREDTPGGPALGSPARHSDGHGSAVNLGLSPPIIEEPLAPMLQPTASKTPPQSRGSASKMGTFFGAMSSPRATLPGLSASYDAKDAKEGKGRASVPHTWSHSTPQKEGSATSPSSISESPPQHHHGQSPQVSPSVPLPKMLNAIDYHPPSSVCSIQ
uniref:Uncharacterized protein n=2 Tax=Hemiselmis andersenii TaxID=464988 RepID=A0A6U2CCI8_HEMAN